MIHLLLLNDEDLPASCKRAGGASGQGASARFSPAGTGGRTIDRQRARGVKPSPGTKRGFLLKLFHTPKPHASPWRQKKDLGWQKSHACDFCQPQERSPAAPGLRFSHASDHTPQQLLRPNANTTPQTMAGSHPNHHIMTNETIHIIAYVLCCLRRSKGLQFP
jgi:hypothetical protein